ncbi:MAG TPA: DUF885 domain-containing protein [Jatrophihabitantaceae bacterium]|nr:DUF885 domain-containing protein [Jatrophihabitantaceae bacterium]
MTTPVRDLADRLAHRILAADPTLGTFLGLREYDGLLPDESAQAEQALVADLQQIDAEAATLDPADAADRITHSVIRSVCAQYAAQVDTLAATYTVSPMPFSGPPALFAMAAHTDVHDEQSAADYLRRLRDSPRWFDTTCDRLREGRAAGRLPVGSLVDQALAWVENALATPIPPALLAPTPPEDWDGAAGWSAEVEATITGAVMPAVVRWRDLLVELRPDARADESAGLAALPGGDQIYHRWIALHTTLELSADELHQIGLDAVTALEQRAVELGAELDLHNLADVITAVRASAAAVDPDASMAAARAAIARAEARAADIMAPPLPDPCAVEAMPATVAEAGMAPHYTPPREDTGRPGTFWFNTMQATAGTGWDLEAVAFHEAVPGHHSQLARTQRLAGLPLLHQLPVTVHAEGWGLYAERLAGEFDLYSDVRAQLGSVYIEMHRAARLVVDTGLHARGWSRQQARQFMIDHVALPEQFLANEIDRYIAWPGQALAYLTGQRELLRLRAQASAELGDAFDLPTFHSVLLDSGSLPMPVLQVAVDDWIADRGRAGT